MVDRRETSEVGEFFDQQIETNDYSSLKAMTRELDVAAARILKEQVAGDVLSVGGVWDWFEWTPEIDSLTVLDLSPRVLDDYCPPGAARVEGDLFEMEFPPRSFDTVVFPLVLHHTPREDWATSQRRVRDALARAHRWLRPNGKVVIVEYCSQAFWAAAQRAALPVTKRFLRHFGQPLVVMQTRRFYETSLAEHFDHVVARQPQPEGFNYWKWYPIFMGVRWLRVPLAVYPRLHVLSGERRGQVTDIDQSSPRSEAHNGDGVGRLNGDVERPSLSVRRYGRPSEDDLRAGIRKAPHHRSLRVHVSGHVDQIPSSLDVGADVDVDDGVGFDRLPHALREAALSASRDDTVRADLIELDGHCRVLRAVEADDVDRARAERPRQPRSDVER